MMHKNFMSFFCNNQKTVLQIASKRKFDFVNCVKEPEFKFR